LAQAASTVAAAELAYKLAGGTARDRARTSRSSQQDGPVFLLGRCALVCAVWAAIGNDPLSEVLGVLRPTLDNALPGLDGQIVADALIGAYAGEFRGE
jgi:hypothetical protein